MIEISYDFTSVSDFLETLFSSRRRFTQILTACWATFGYKDVIEHFKDQTADGLAWPSRKQSTNDRYDAINAGLIKPPAGYRKGSFRSSNRLLQLTGRLRQSFVFGGSKGETTIEPKGDTAIMITNNVEYSGTHEYGNPSKRIPSRSFMWLSEKARENMAELILDHVFGGT